ncbi:NmrA family NAD(P)-binding protein [Nocardia miyunensis]|uniref:NmrA family NAD(P)-binding protein n=1 Tax=Nocardia miyunensis TaxID=282684 RepID=UPI000A048680
MTKSVALVLGATGGQGGAVADDLLSRGAAVRAMARDTRSPRAQRLGERGVELVGGSLDDRAALTAAMANVAGVFAVTSSWREKIWGSSLLTSWPSRRSISANVASWPGIPPPQPRWPSRSAMHWGALPPIGRLHSPR